LLKETVKISAIRLKYLEGSPIVITDGESAAVITRIGELYSWSQHWLLLYFCYQGHEEFKHRMSLLMAVGCAYQSGYEVQPLFYLMGDGFQNPVDD
jgi:hypothetical protein